MDFYTVFTYLVLLLAFSADLILCQNCPVLILKNGRVRTRNRGHMASFTCNEGFNRVGPRFSVCLNTGLWTQKKPLCVGGQCQPIEGIPNLKVEPLHDGSVLRFSCNPGFYRQGPQEIYCDGNTWSSPTPACIEGASLGCDFETEGMCGWSQDESDNFDWTWHKGHTPTSDTGPSIDHTTKSADGHYIYIESSAPTKKDYRARLLSPIYQPDDVIDYCLQFYYHMLGSDDPGEMGRLDVFVQPASVRSSILHQSNAIFQVEGNKGDVWHKADMKIPLQHDEFKIIFQAKRQNSWNSDIAIDDIKLYSCPEGPELPLDGTVTITMTTMAPNTTIADVTAALTNATSPIEPEVTPTVATPTSDAGDHNATTFDNGTTPNDTVTSSYGDNTTSEVDHGSTENGTSLHFEPTRESTETHPDDSATYGREHHPHDDATGTHKGTGRTAAASTNTQILPVVIGVLMAVVVAVIFIAVILWVVSRRKEKRDEQLEDELKIITQGQERQTF